MEWGEYYRKFDEWATSTQISRLSALTSYGPSDEVTEVARGLMDETAASRLIRRALAAGVQFTAEEICELVNCCNAAVMNALLENSLCAFTREQLEDLWGVVDDAVLEQTARRCRVKLFDDGEEEEEEEEDDRPKIAVIGKPNAGKSSFLNALLGEERAIVTDIAGTTRDTLEESVTIDGITLNIVDTAGIRDTEDKVESIGVERAKKEIESADLILFLMDTSVQISEEDIEILQRIRDKKKIILLNKSDKATEESGFEQSALKEYISEETPVISISAKYGDGIDNFIMELKNMMFHGRIDVNQEVYITNARHKDALAKTYESLECVERSIEAGMPEDFFTIDLMNAYEKLGLIIGESVEEDLVNEIFSKFCTGK